MRTIVACTLFAVAPLAWGDTLRCGDRLVRTEALAAEVIAACGAPDYRQISYGGPAYGVDEEQWYYNFGSQRLVRVLRFRRGELVSIAADGYGFDARPASRCRATEIRSGVSAFRLLRACGEPASREAFEESSLAQDDPEDAPPPQYRERWVYDLGSDTRMRIVTLREGRVTDVTLGHYGSDPER
jgi:hypothetical protein